MDSSPVQVDLSLHVKLAKVVAPNCPYFVGSCPRKTKDCAQPICVCNAGCLVDTMKFNLLVHFCCRHSSSLLFGSLWSLWCFYLIIPSFAVNIPMMRSTSPATLSASPTNSTNGCADGNVITTASSGRPSSPNRWSGSCRILLDSISLSRRPRAAPERTPNAGLPRNLPYDIVLAAPCLHAVGLIQHLSSYYPCRLDPPLLLFRTCCTLFAVNSY